MEFRVLEYFLAVCEELHFTKAAERLGISQPTLSQQIRVLEDRLGTPLFRRIGKKNYITEAGHILRNHAIRVFYELEQAQIKITEIKGLQRGKLRIGCSGNHLLTTTIVSFHEKYPNISLSVIELATEETRHGLLNNELDMGVVFLPLEDANLISHPLYTEELSLAVSSVHPLAKENSIPFNDLQNLSLILFPEKFLVRKMVDTYGKEVGIILTPILELSTMDSMMQMVRLNIGATILPKSYLHVNYAQDQQIKIIPIIEPIPQKTVGIVYRNESMISLSMKAFIHELKGNYQS
ncbi:LysR family transcriptional regulator [Paenibacillus sp. FA6]|uniref:LysR family transcriptional regulator n=1 Tax=Paenibacillus sp. FA6 TaxID=3413029 RepID=UPI003F65B21A